MKATTFIVTGLCVLLLAMTALAGDGYSPDARRDASSWKPIAAAVLAMAAVGVVAFKKSKRTHLD